MKKLLFILSLFISAITNGQGLGPATYAAQNKPNNPIVIYNKSFWKDITTDWTTTSLTPVKNADSSFRIPTGAGNFSDFMILNGATNNDENIDFEIQFKPTALTTGIKIGRKTSNSTFAASLSVGLDFSGATTVLKMDDGVTIGNIYSASIAPLPTANDMISETYMQRGNTFVVFYRNLSTGFFAATLPIIANLQAVGGGSNWYMPNTGNFCIWDYNAGPTDVLSIKITSFSNPNPKILVVSDSKGTGISSNYINARWTNLIKTLGSVVVMAGVGDKTSDILADTTYIFAHFNPKYVILNIGRNDIANSVAAGTYEANYDAIVAAFKKHGITVIHLLPIPEVSVSQTTLTTYINATYSADAIVDPSIGWINGTDCSSDNVHPNPAGHRLIANQVKANTGIVNNKDQFEYPPFPNYNLDAPPAATGSSKYIQYNTNGSLDASSLFQFDVSTASLSLGRANTSGGAIDAYSLTASRTIDVTSGLTTGAAYYRAINSATNAAYFGVVGPSWSTSGITAANMAFFWGTSGGAGIAIETKGTGGSAAPIVFGVNGAEVARYDITGHYVPGVTATSNLGSSSLKWKDLWLSGNSNIAGNFTMTAAGGSFNITEGSNGRVGQVALVAGTKAITITGLTTSSRAFVTLVTPNTVTSTVNYQAVCTSNTLTIQANVAAGTINTADISTLNYFVIN